MKAEKRHELQTNYLADHLGKFYTNARSWSGVFWLLAIVVVASIVLIIVVPGRTQARNTKALLYLEEQRNAPGDPQSKIKLFQEIVLQRVKGTAAEQPARLELADLKWKLAYSQFQNSTPDGRAEALKSFEDAARAYEELSKESTDSSDLEMRALSGAAKCEAFRGQLDRAKYFYKELLVRYAKLPEDKKNAAKNKMSEMELIEVVQGAGDLQPFLVKVSAAELRRLLENKEAGEFYSHFYGS